MERSVADIVRDAKNTTKLQTLIYFWNEVVSNKYKYSLESIKFARRSIMELTLNSEGEDIEKGKFWSALKEQD
jgi:hypothetical protein